MAQAGQEIEGPEGFRLLLVQTAAETGGELLEMEARYAGTDQLPPAHLHPSQDEHFEVLEGRVRAVVDGVESTYGPGAQFDVPAGTPHQMTGVEPSRVKWEVRPALRMAEFFESLYALMAQPEPDGAAFGALLEHFSAEFRLT